MDPFQQQFDPSRTQATAESHKPEDSSFFSQALSFIQDDSNVKHHDEIANADAEKAIVDAHKQTFGGEGGDENNAGSREIGRGAAVEAMKMFVGGHGGGATPGGHMGHGGGGQQDFVGLAMAQAAKYFDKQNGGHASHGSGSSNQKQDAINMAAKVAMQMLSKGSKDSAGAHSGMGGMQGQLGHMLGQFMKR